ncbi:TetR/AcrR family transcriptional regulator [Pedobacter yulinensis]|uniref:TetR/AcrR family transcriptional regulator n=1 Tax=Pedobacter yulinensis TaxID=2126353 RepID=A0A2T3HPL1_9SPHI|nr:TetR/AcrR family transcriptional regulator [Pedobacter yulinensis]PST84384.1 TetR/AcrR family transcriptional regulator [Pedobacter yulinensis]
MENQDKKRILILEAALKRFAHFGLAKTTMTDIAKDLSLSKALLYYYFPDKISLYVSVIDHIMHTVSNEIKKAVKKADNCADAIMVLIEKRQAFIQKYHNLLEYGTLIKNDIPQDLFEKFNKAKEFEVNYLSELFRKGSESGEFRTEDPVLNAEILTDALFGIRFNVTSSRHTMFAANEDFKKVFRKERQLASVFIRGLKSH